MPQGKALKSLLTLVQPSILSQSGNYNAGPWILKLLQCHNSTMYLLGGLTLLFIQNY
jgi:hypothetical protein